MGRGHGTGAYPEGEGVAGAASVAVEEVLASSHAADAAVLAVILLLGGFVVEEVALHARVGAEGDPALPAVGANRLALVADSTDDLADFPSVYLVHLLGVLWATGT